MTIQEKILNDMKDAMKAGSKVMLETLRMIRSQLKNAAIARGGELEEADVIAVLTKEAKRRKESLEMYQKGGREDLADRESKEWDIITQYLPEALSDAEIEDIVNTAIKQSGAESMRDMGKVMGAVMPQIKGRADGKIVQEIVRKKLS
jgi:uncharacterized protein YqeY